MARSQKSGLNGTAKEKNVSQYVISQDSCMLLQLPGETRNLIYSHLFTSTRLTFGERNISRSIAKLMKPAPNSLAILRTCHLIKQEAGDLWLGQVLFNFEHAEDMLDKLSALPLTTLSQIRHIRVGGHTMMLPSLGNDNVFQSFVWAPKLLPGLCLDTLSVLGPSTGSRAYETLDELVKYGNGWKELHYITRDSAMLGLKMLNKRLNKTVEPQPSTWHDVLIQRDGLDSGASVTIHQSTKSDVPGTVVKRETRQLFEQKPPSPEDLGKELLVIVKRGHQAHILEQDGPPKWTQGLTWAEIRDAPDFIEEDEDVAADRYNDVDVYLWDPVH
jgi:hypothetical protein